MSEEMMMIGGLQVPVVHTPRGLKLSLHHPAFEPLAWIVNLALEGELGELRETLERGGNVNDKGVFATVQASGEYRLSGDFFAATMTLPAATILEVLSTLTALRIPEQPRVIPEPVDLPPPPVRVLLERPDLPRSWPDLELRAAELDRKTLRERTDEHLTDEARHRAFLLLDLQDAGLFDRQAARPEGFPTLCTYYDAGRKLARYLESEERALANPDAEPTRIIGAPISVDWYRIPQPPGPDHVSELQWLAHLEGRLGDDNGDDRGTIYVFAGADVWVLHWRTDDGVHPAVVSVTPPIERQRPSAGGSRRGEIYRGEGRLPSGCWTEPGAQAGVLEILNRPERVFTGIDDDSREVDIYWAGDTVVITEAGQKDVVVTAYGPAIDGPGAARVDPEQWAIDPSYREVVPIRGEPEAD